MCPGAGRHVITHDNRKRPSDEVHRPIAVIDGRLRMTRDVRGSACVVPAGGEIGVGHADGRPGRAIPADDLSVTEIEPLRVLFCGKPRRHLVDELHRLDRFQLGPDIGVHVLSPNTKSLKRV